MANLDARAAWILLTVLALTAVIGLEQGLVRGLSAVRESGAAAAPADPEREPVPRAQPLTAPPVDEATVRQIAREEAEAAIARSRPKKAAPQPDADTEADGSDTAAPTTPGSAAPAAPAAAAPAAPAPG